jgi:hypothetical protein
MQRGNVLDLFISPTFHQSILSRLCLCELLVNPSQQNPHTQSLEDMKVPMVENASVSTGGVGDILASRISKFIGAIPTIRTDSMPSPIKLNCWLLCMAVLMCIVGREQTVERWRNGPW